MALSVLDGIMINYEDTQGLANEQPFILIGNPGNKRTLGLQAARSSQGLKQAVMVPYLALLQRSLRIGDVLYDTVQRRRDGGHSSSVSPMIRLDAPGEDPEVERELLAWGAPEFTENDAFCAFEFVSSGASITAEEARQLPIEQGRIMYPAQWFRGYCRFLYFIKKEAENAGFPIVWVNDPADIAVMFDKRSCSQLLTKQGVSMPALPAPAGAIVDYDTLQQAIALSGMNRLFIKLACGSGAAGVMAYQIHPVTGAELAVTTIGFEERAGERVYYNSGILRRYSDKEVIRRIVNWLCLEGAHVERWIEKESLEGKSFDVRQLVVNGGACHAVLRLSSTPITNLHLRNERQMMTEEILSSGLKQQVERAAISALSAFSNSSVAGVDVLVRRGSHETYVVDINPFGDLLYHVDYLGLNTYEWQMQQLQGKD
ncbi:MAG TPA: STM4014 family protein [Paenibacillus sp.]